MSEPWLSVQTGVLHFETGPWHASCIQTSTVSDRGAHLDPLVPAATGEWLVSMCCDIAHVCLERVLLQSSVYVAKS